MEGTDRPDRFSNAWWAEQARGISHLQRLLSAKQANQDEDLAAALNRIAVLEQADAENKARIGELLAKVEELTTRMDKAANVVAGLKKGAAA